MQLEDLKVIQHITPYWGQGHYLASTPADEVVEVLIAERSSESITSLLSWASALERVDHPSVPQVKTIVHQRTTFVVLQQREGLPLSHCIHQHHDQLSRLDILALFYQLATALRQLHDHGLTHANLTLDQMKVVGEGNLLLQGWAPPTIDQHFAHRCADDLRRFKNFFYLTLVGDFPPKRQVLEESEAVSPLERQRLSAWRHWYQLESVRPQPNLSASPLLLFSETPQHAQALVEELAPYLDSSLNHFYQGLHQELTRREGFESLCTQREQLLNELDRIYKITRIWLKQHETDRLLGDRHCHAIERLHDHASHLHEQLEHLGGKSFYGATQMRDELSPYMSQGSNTLLYEQVDLRPSFDELQSAKTFGGTLNMLEQQWSQVDPHRPISVPPNEISHLMTSATALNSHDAQPHHGLAQQIAALVERAQLPPLRQRDPRAGFALNEAYLPSWEASNLSDPQDYSEQIQSLSELGIEPLPTSEELIHVANQRPDDPQLTQMFQRSSLSIEGGGALNAASRVSIPTFSAFIPDATATNFTEHYRARQPLPPPENASEAGPKVALSPRNFFVFLYVATILIFGWSMSLELFPQWHRDSDASERSIPQAENRVVSPSLAAGTVTPTKRQTRRAPEPQKLRGQSLTGALSEHTTTPGAEASHHNADSGLQLNASHNIESVEAIPEVAPSPTRASVIPPDDMAYIPGGITYSGLGEGAYQTAVSYCVFEPRYGKEQRSRESCKRQIPVEQKVIKAFSVSPFFMDIYEVSRGEYLAYCRNGGACKSRLNFTKDELNLPMVNLSMLEAHDYCRRQKKTLPTYEQWLAASRGDQQFVYPWGNHPVRKSHRVYRANYLSSKRKLKRSQRSQEIDGHIGPHGVRVNAEHSMSPYGVAHLVGNVNEWVMKNKFKEGFAAGGGWRTPIWNLRVTTGELFHKYEYRSDDLGFRCVRALNGAH